MQVVKFPDDFYDEGVVKFAAGSYHPLNSETQSLVNSGHAELLDPEHMHQDVEALKALAKLARDRADSCAVWAQELAKEADEAEQLAAAAEAVNKKPAGKKQSAAPKVQTSAASEPATETK